MKISKLYRTRYIPAETVLLKNDEILEQNDSHVITRWNTLNTKSTFSHGCSCYFLKNGIKVSKFYKHDGSLLYWYCDIVEYSYDEEAESLTVTDLLADVVVYPDGHFKVVDLDELADALEQSLITADQMTCALRSLNYLLTMIYRDKFDQLQVYLDSRGL